MMIRFERTGHAPMKARLPKKGPEVRIERRPRRDSNQGGAGRGRAVRQLVIESLLYAIRTAAFAVPQGVGVQEGAYVLLGAGFGLTPEMSLALSLLKRARDLTIGLPAIAVWQAIEGGRLWRRRAARAAFNPLAKSIAM